MNRWGVGKPVNNANTLMRLLPSWLPAGVTARMIPSQWNCCVAWRWRTRWMMITRWIVGVAASGGDAHDNGGGGLLPGNAVLPA